MPKIKVYEHDYEWTGQENKPKGVNIQEKHPWNKPNWGENPVGQSHSATSYDLHPDRFDMDELQRRHQWETPQWATVKGRCENMNRDVISDPIPKPMLKTTGSSGSPGKNGSTSADIRNKTRKPDEMDKEIADMKRQIEEVKQKKEALMKQKQEEDEHERTKHTIKESKIEKARRLAKEREDARWRATLAERNQRDKEKREQARLAALRQSNLTSSSSDNAWQKTRHEQEQRYQERIQHEALKRQTMKDQEITIETEKDYEEAIEENIEGAESSIAPTIDALQSQIDELRRQLKTS